jgi:hypothetical protein
MLIGGTSTSKYSNNYGYTWSDFTGLSGGEGLSGACISADGNYKVVCAGSNSKILVGTDWINWTTTTLPTTYINSPSISYDGKYILVVSSNEYQGNDTKIFVSNDYGATFTTITTETNQSWRTSAMSLDGKYMIAGGGHQSTGYGTVYNSTDYGVTWNIIPEMSSLSLWTHVNISKSGKYSYVTNLTSSSEGGVYHSKDYMSSWTHQFDGSIATATLINF